MKQYEYKIVPLPEIRSPLSTLPVGPNGEETYRHIEEGLCYLGREGWEFVAIIGALAVFQREKDCTAGSLCNKNFKKGNDTQ